MCENVVHGTEHDHENRKNGRMCLQSSTMSEHIEITPEIIEIRHYLHAHPERSFKEYETSAYIEKLLRAHDIEVLNNPLETGVVGLIRGDQPGPRIALRADIDGLPIQEDTGLPFSSVNDGVMHGCGHDLHMSYMLGAAFWLAKRRKHIKAPSNCCSSPPRNLASARRHGRRGTARRRISRHRRAQQPELRARTDRRRPRTDDGRLREIPCNPARHRHTRRLSAQGTGPIEALATMVLALQTIVSRNVSPFHPLVLSITEMHGGHVWNVVPDKASFQGTVRYFHKSDGELVEKRFKQQVQSIAAGYGITADIDWDDFQNPLVSDTELSKIVADNVRDYAQLEPIHPSMAGEDFCDFMPVTMPVFAFIGSNGEEGARIGTAAFRRS